MSWWTNFRDAAEGVMTGGIAGAFNQSLANKEGAAFNKITGRASDDEKRNQQYAINDQIKAYKEATDLTNQALATKQSEMDVEKRRVNEKQIRALRNNFRSSGGFLNNQSSATGDAALPTKLGA